MTTTPRRNRKLVKNMREAFLFEEDMFDEMQEGDDEEEVDRVISNMDDDSLSTGFTGTASAEVAAKVPLSGSWQMWFCLYLLLLP